MTEDDPPHVWHITVCRKAACPVADVAFRSKLYVNADGIFRAVCGQCGQTPEMTEDEDQINDLPMRLDG